MLITQRLTKLVNSNQTSVIRIVALALPTSKRGSVNQQNHAFLTALSQINSKEESLFFSTDEQEMIMKAFTVIMSTIEAITTISAL